MVLTFDFPDGREEQILAKLAFEQNSLVSITNMDNQRNLAFPS